MALIIIFAQWLMEKSHLKPQNHYVPCEFNIKTQIIKWTKLLVVFAIIALIPFKTHQIFFLAPPLIVTFTEFSNTSSPLRDRPFTIIGLMTLAATVGCLLRETLNIYLHFPLTICTILACCILFFTFDKNQNTFSACRCNIINPDGIKN